MQEAEQVGCQGESVADMERDYESDSDCLYVAESISQNGIRQMKLTFFFDISLWEISFWRPLTLLCTNYKILLKVLPSRFKNFIDLLVQVDQSYCLPDRSMLDNVFVMKDVFDVCKTYHLNVGIVSIDQKKEFDLVDHTLFSTFKAFGVGNVFLSWVRFLYANASCVVKVGGGLSSLV